MSGTGALQDSEQLRALRDENENLKELLAERQHLLEQMIPPPVVADLLERQRRARSLSDVWSWQPESVANQGKARFLRRESATDAPHVGQAKAVFYDSVTVFFSDIVGFTDMSKAASPMELMTFLDELYSKLDELISRHHSTLWKVETIGDAYMVAGGLMEVPGCPKNPEDTAREVISFARDAVRAASSLTMPNGNPCQLRVGVHTGPLMSGVVGSKMPRYCLFGETVNLASRMESTGVPNAVQVSERTWGLLGETLTGSQEALAPEGDQAPSAAAGLADDGMRWRSRGGISVKGKGTMQTYVLEKPAQDHDEPAKKAIARWALPAGHLLFGRSGAALFIIGFCPLAFVLTQAWLGRHSLTRRAVRMN